MGIIDEDRKMSFLNEIIKKDHICTMVRNLPLDIEVVLGRYQGWFTYDRFGNNPSINTNSVADIWDNGGIYTGFPLFTDQLEIVLSDPNDIGGSIDFRYVSSEQDKDWINASIKTTGLITNTGLNVYRSTEGRWDGSGSAVPGVNSGQVTLRHINNNSNVFFVILPGNGTSRSACEYILPDSVGILKRASIQVGKKNTAILTGALWLREKGKTHRLVRPFVVTNLISHNDEMIYGMLIKGGTDISIRILSCDSNGIDCYGLLDLLTVRY